MPRVTIAVDFHAWHSLKVAAARLDITILELIAKIGQGDTAAIVAYQREYQEGQVSKDAR